MRQWKLYIGGIAAALGFWFAYRALEIWVPAPVVELANFEQAIRNLYSALYSWRWFAFLVLGVLTLPTLLLRPSSSSPDSTEEQFAAGDPWRSKSSLIHLISFAAGLLAIYVLLPRSESQFFAELGRSLPAIMIVLLFAIPTYLIAQQGWQASAGGWDAYRVASVSLLLGLGLFGITVVPAEPWILACSAVALSPTTLLMIPILSTLLLPLRQGRRSFLFATLMLLASVVLLLGSVWSGAYVLARREPSKLALAFRIVALILVTIVLGVATWHSHRRREAQTRAILESLHWEPGSWTKLRPPVLKPTSVSVKDAGPFTALLKVIVGILGGIVNLLALGANFLLRIIFFGASLLLSTVLWTVSIAWSILSTIAVHALFTLIDLPNYLAFIAEVTILDPFDVSFRYVFHQILSYACAVAGLALFLHSALDYFLMGHFFLLLRLALGLVMWLLGIALSVAAITQSTFMKTTNLLLVDPASTCLTQVMGYGLTLCTLISWLLVLLAPRLGIAHFRPGFLTWAGTATLLAAIAFWVFGHRWSSPESTD